MKDTTNNELLEFMKEQFEGVGGRFDKVDERLEKFDSRLNGLENRMDIIANLFTQDHFDRFHRLEKQVAKLIAAK